MHRLIRVEDDNVVSECFQVDDVAYSRMWVIRVGGNENEGALP